jgi:malate dehydrogenase
MNRVAKLTGHLTANNTSGTCPVSGKSTATGSKRPINVVVTGAAGNIAYSCLFQIGQGALFGLDQPINLTLLDIPPAAKKLEGVVMELHDGAFPILASIKATTDYREAFTGCEAALLIGARPRGKGMDRSDLLKANAAIFAGQGKALNQFASRNCKVVVVGNPCNTNALLAMKNAPSLPKENFSALTRLDQNRAQGILGARLGVNCSRVKNVIIWGNHSSTQFPDIRHAHISDFPHAGMTSPVRTAAVADQKWLDEEFVPKVAKRGGAIIAARGASSAASAAKAAIQHMRSWFLGTCQGEIVNMAVHSNGEYGAPKGVFFSFPVTCKNGTWTIVPDLPLDDESRARIKKSGDELVKERTAAFSAV